MGYYKYFSEINAQKQINKLSRKYRGKRIIIYGAGIMSDVLVKNFDLTPLNIIGFCDARFDINSKEKFYNYQTFNPEELETIDFDVLLFNLYNAIGVINNVMFQKLIDTKNENIFFDELLKPTAIFFLKQLFK